MAADGSIIWSKPVAADAGYYMRGLAEPLGLWSKMVAFLDMFLGQTNINVRVFFLHVSWWSKLKLFTQIRVSAGVV